MDLTTYSSTGSYSWDLSRWGYPTSYTVGRNILSYCTAPDMFTSWRMSDKTTPEHPRVTMTYGAKAFDGMTIDLDKKNLIAYIESAKMNNRDHHVEQEALEGTIW